MYRIRMKDNYKFIKFSLFFNELALRPIQSLSRNVHGKCGAIIGEDLLYVSVLLSTFKERFPATSSLKLICRGCSSDGQEAPWPPPPQPLSSPWLPIIKALLPRPFLPLSSSIQTVNIYFGQRTPPPSAHRHYSVFVCVKIASFFSPSQF